MTDKERQSIIQQHSTVYDGYATGNVQSNMTPLTVYDATKDKGGITVDNKGNVKTYQNHKINESVIFEEKQICNECGGEMMEGECMECGSMYEGDIQELGGMDDGHPHFGDLNFSKLDPKKRKI